MPPTRRSRTAAAPEPSPARSHALDAVFRPRSVAVIGASRRRNSIGREILGNLLGFQFNGPVFPVNPTAGAVHSMKAYRSIEEVPDEVDLAVIVVPSAEVLSVIEGCGRKGVRAVVVITAGFREVGPAGLELERLLKQALDRHGIRMVGPNCMGVINTEPEVRLNATFAAATPARGNVGFVSQSGALGEAILADAAASGLGVAMFASMGNKTDISGNDLLEYWEDNDDVQAILMYLESFGNPGRFTQIARRVTRKKPVITVKAGRTADGARAATSHTGSIVGMDVATESLFEQCGVIRVSSMEEMFVQASALSTQPVPDGDRVAIVTNAGGPGILCTDSCIGRGLRLAEFSAETRRALAEVLPPEASTANPVDMIASADGERFRAVLDRVARDPGVDGVITIFVSPVMIDAYEVARAIVGANDGRRPLLSVFMGKARGDEGVRLLREHRVPVFRFPEQAASAMSALSRYRELRDRPRGDMVRYEVDRPRASRAVAAARAAGRSDLSLDETWAVLEAYGLRPVSYRLAGDAAEAVSLARDTGFPVVLKAVSDTLSHKTDVGGVKVDLRNDDEVRAAYLDLEGRLAGGDPSFRVAVQRLVEGGREVILGMVRDVQFGPVLMFGLGGIHVEVLRDVSVRVHPLTDAGAREMIRRIRGFPLLEGTRGEGPVALAAIEQALLRLSQLVSDFEDDLAEMDINPFIVTGRAEDSYVVDARIALRPPAG